jgi:hypothetical protein
VKCLPVIARSVELGERDAAISVPVIANHDQSEAIPGLAAKKPENLSHAKNAKAAKRSRK